MKFSISSKFSSKCSTFTGLGTAHYYVRGWGRRNNNTTLENVIPHSICPLKISQPIKKSTEVSYPMLNFLGYNKDVAFRILQPFNNSANCHLHFDMYCCLKSVCKNQWNKLKYHECRKHWCDAMITALLFGPE